MSINNLYSISPVDGRYSSAVKELNSLFSEYGLIKFRLLVEIEWFLHLSNEKSINPRSRSAKFRVALKKI